MWWNAARLSLLVAAAGCSRPAAATFSGTVQAPSAAVGSPVGGRVTAVLAQEGQRVRAGQVLLRFDDAQTRAAWQSARHEEAAAAAALADLRAGARMPDVGRARDEAREAREAFERARLSRGRQIALLGGSLAQARAQLADVLADESDAHGDALRARSLYASGDLSGRERDAAAARDARARAQVGVAQAALRNAETELAQAARVTLPRDEAAAHASASAAENAYRSVAAGARPDALRAAAASLAAAASNVVSARSRWDDTVVRAPADGVVSAFDLHPGDLIAPGAAAAVIDEAGEPYVRIYVPQSMLARIHVGDELDVRPDSQPGVRLSGTVEALDEQAQFTPLSVQTQDDRAELSFGVKIRIHDRAHPVHGGTTATIAFS